MNTINFAIDLGTTNSLIAKQTGSEIKLYNNPIGLKQTLASCVAFRPNRTLIGDKAYDYLEKDAQNVCMLFKRKMGSNETFQIPNLDKEISPVELSALVLKELKNFVQEEKEIPSVVITIPASFDTIQSNATKKAGYQAGFKEVVLLQEPIAACLAFANKANLDIQESKKWIVYDFGGGTFDVALVEIDDRELKVLDNEGDNFLGGADLDNLLVEKLFIPFIENHMSLMNLWKEVKVKNSKYKGLYFELLKKAEDAKKELSHYPETEIEFDLEIEGTDFYQTLTITRLQFEEIIKENVSKTIAFTKEIIRRNNLVESDIERIVLIGGTTYIPYIKQELALKTGIEVDDSINPTSAVVEGAAYYAGAKPSTIVEAEDQRKDEQLSSVISSVEAQVFYEQNTRDLEELITGKLITGSAEKYRITRNDGGYDSGINQLQNEGFSEFVPLIAKQLNTFKLQFLDANLVPVYTLNNIVINHGTYNVLGQTIPNDICLEIDDLDVGSTRLEKIFEKGSILPVKKKIYKTASKTILNNSSTSVLINVIEGDANSLPSSGLSIGFIEVSGKDLEEDLIKGTDIEIELELSESRDLKVTVYLQSCDQEIANTFSESERAISLSKIELEISTILTEVEAAIKENNLTENFEFSNKLETIRVGLIELQIQATLLDDSDLTDEKYQLDDTKRKLIRDFDLLTRNEKISQEIEAYYESKDYVIYHINEEENERFKSKYENIIKNEKDVINSGNKYLIKAKTKELDVLYDSIIKSSDENFIGIFFNLKFIDSYLDNKKAQKFLKQGDDALEKKDYKSLRYIVYNLFALLPDRERERKELFKDDSRTGLS